MSEIEDKIKRAWVLVPHLFDAPSRSNIQENARTLLPGLTLNIGAQVEEVRMKKGLLAEIVPDILPHLGGIVDRLRSTTKALSVISSVLGRRVSGKGHQDRKGRHEKGAAKATKGAKACPLCAEQGRGNVIHTYQRRITKWPAPDHIDWPSWLITSCPAFTIMKPEEREDAVLRLGVCSR